MLLEIYDSGWNLRGQLFNEIGNDRKEDNREKWLGIAGVAGRVSERKRKYSARYADKDRDGGCMMPKNYEERMREEAREYGYLSLKEFARFRVELKRQLREKGVKFEPTEPTRELERKLEEGNTTNRI